MIIRFVSLFVIAGLVSTQQIFAEDYPILDGRRYNGLSYPNVDILEWGDPLHLEFQVYEKTKPVNVTGKTVKAGDRKVFVFTIDFPERGERLCRRVLAPKDFTPDAPVYLSKETHDIDMNNFIFSNKPIPGKTAKLLVGVDDCVEIKPSAPIADAKKPVPVEERPPAFVVEDSPEPKSRQPASIFTAPSVNVRGEFQPAKPVGKKTDQDIKSDIYEDGMQKPQEDFSWFK